MEILTRTLTVTVTVAAENIEDAEALADTAQMAVEALGDGSIEGTTLMVAYEGDKWADDCGVCGAESGEWHAKTCRA